MFNQTDKGRARSIRRHCRARVQWSGLICDQVVELTVFYSHQGYPERLRRIRFKDPETAKTLVFLTNNFALPALTIGALYKSRWSVELFFRWIKQHLRIKRFFGTSENAVKTQVWTAVAVYVLVAIIRKRLDLQFSAFDATNLERHTVRESTAISVA